MDDGEDGGDVSGEDDGDIDDEDGDDDGCKDGTCTNLYQPLPTHTNPY